jgi:hypothetical protein
VPSTQKKERARKPEVVCLRSLRVGKERDCPHLSGACLEPAEACPGTHPRSPGGSATVRVGRDGKGQSYSIPIRGARAKDSGRGASGLTAQEKMSSVRVAASGRHTRTNSQSFSSISKVDFFLERKEPLVAGVCVRLGWPLRRPRRASCGFPLSFSTLRRRRRKKTTQNGEI